MEILNKNRRSRAFWRVFLLGALVLGLLSMATYKIHYDYKDQGRDELLKCQQECELKVRTLESQNADKTVIINRLRTQIKDMEDAAADPDELQRLTQEREKAKDDEIERLDRRNQELERELNSCKSALAAQRNFK